MTISQILLIASIVVGIINICFQKKWALPLQAVLFLGGALTL